MSQRSKLINVLPVFIIFVHGYFFIIIIFLNKSTFDMTIVILCIQENIYYFKDLHTLVDI